MKTKIIIVPLSILLGMIIISSFQGCKKYPDGPAISLRSKTERVANTWKIENYKINGSDFTSLVSDYTETFTRDGAYSYSWGILNGSSNWAFQSDKKEIKLSGESGQTSRTLYILKLEEKSFWYYYLDGNDRHDVHLTGN